MDIHSISKITLRSRDFARTERFYRELFGWRFHQYSPTYLGFEPPSGIGGGFQLRDSPAFAGKSLSRNVRTFTAGLSLE
jgi:predicted enzyme related to lactoylglutathione lyase